MDPTTSSTKKKPAANRKKLDTAADDDDKEAPLSSCGCFFCAAREPDARVRRAALSAFFRAMPRSDDSSHVLVASFVWNLAMSDPADPELPSAGALRCMALLIARALDADAGPSWLRRHQNVYIPYYAAHVIGSYTIRVPSLAALAVEEGAVAPLLGLMRGSMTWVEQRVAVRALGHLASYDATYPAVARHADELVPLAMRIASACLGRVYAEFLAVSPPQRERCHRDLLTRGLGGAETENRKAEEWASQLQCWSLYLLSCFAFRDRRTHGLVCRDAEFLSDLCRMWGASSTPTPRGGRADEATLQEPRRQAEHRGMSAGRRQPLLPLAILRRLAVHGDRLPLAASRRPRDAYSSSEYRRAVSRRPGRAALSRPKKERRRRHRKITTATTTTTTT
uniref:ARM repeat N-terminal plant domain-containing protein n=1 Tax=Ananas comosus var. bracteatus TaxID=296719 RepID=A0A6V7Q4B7_ANACO|nr:unnamed protein product [Ananas comosus var. bracteatus]